MLTDTPTIIFRVLGAYVGTLVYLLILTVTQETTVEEHTRIPRQNYRSFQSATMRLVRVSHPPIELGDINT